MARQWFYRRGDETQGPISADELRALAFSGGLQDDDRVWPSEVGPERALSGAVVRQHLAPGAVRTAAPDWLRDIQELEQLGPEPRELPPAAGMPDWVADLKQAGLDQERGPPAPGRRVPRDPARTCPWPGPCAGPSAARGSPPIRARAPRCRRPSCCPQTWN